MSEERKPLLTEDWSAVLFAFAIVLLVGIGFAPSLLSVSWNTQKELIDYLTASFGLKLLGLFVFTFVVVTLYFFIKRIPFRIATIGAYFFLFFITLLAHIATGHAVIKSYGLEIVLFSLLIGLIISNVFHVPEWIKPVLQTELYIKIGLVFLGCSILFADIMKAGALGLLQSVAVVFIVWQFCFWLGKRFGLDDELRTMLSSAVAICGVSAAIATAGAIKGDSKKLSYVISLVLITAVPMLIFMPYAAKAMGLNEAVAGAWMGGTIDTTGAVTAAGEMIGEEGLKYATIVKLSQNVLLGFAAFAISIYWTYSKKENQDTPSIKTIWERFPKFVIGFLLASLIFSLVLSSKTVAEIKVPLKAMQNFWFALAFTSIGLETKFKDVFREGNGKPAAVFLIAQLFNIIFTLLLAWLIFGGGYLYLIDLI